MKFCTYILLFGFALIGATQTTEPESVHLTDFEVTTHPYARNQSEIAQPTQVVDLAEVNRRPALTLGEMLGRQPGVSPTYFGPGASRPIIRALGGPRVAVLQNGADNLDVSVISPDHAVSIDPLLVERVEITRGPAALLQGGTAIGGAVNVVTHRIHADLPGPGAQGRFEGRWGSVNEERSGALVVEGSSGALAWHVDAFYRETDDLDIPGYAESKCLRAAEEDDHEEEEHEEEEAFATLPNSFVESSGGSMGLSWVTDHGFFGGAVSTFETRYGIPPGAHQHAHEEEEEEHEDDEEHEEDHEEDEEELVSIDLQQQRFELQGERRNPVASLRSLRWNAAYADYEHTEFEGEEIGTVFTKQGYDFRLDALHQPWGSMLGAIGLQFTRHELDVVGAEAFLPASITETLATMIFEEIETDQGLWQLGGRADWQRINLDDGSRRNDRGFAWAGSAGWIREVDDHWTVATSISVTERLPIAPELYADGPHIGTGAYEIGDPGLDQERSMGIDLSVRRDGEIVSGIVTAFVNDFDGFIFLSPTGQEEDELPVFVYEQHDARFYGAEASATIHLVHDETGHLDLTLGADMVNATNRTDATHLPRITPRRLRAGLEWQRQGLRLGTEIMHVTQQDRLAPEETPTDAYDLWSAYAGYRFVAGNTTWDWYLRGTNLTDADARIHTSFLKDIAPLPGRNVSLSMRLSF